MHLSIKNSKYLVFDPKQQNRTGNLASECDTVSTFGSKRKGQTTTDCIARGISCQTYLSPGRLDETRIRGNMTSKAQTDPRKEFDREVLQYLNSLYGYALHLSHNTEDAADLVQDTYARAFRSFKQYSLGTNAKAWLFAILRNTFLNQRRAERRRPSEIHCDWIDELPAEDISETARRGPDPYRSFLNNLMREDISKALIELPEDFRSAVVLCDVEGFSYSEIAGILNVPVGTVRSRIHRGRSRLRKRLEEWYSGEKGDT